MDYIVNKENEIYYECGWSSDNAMFLKLGDYKYVITDGRYILEAKEEADAEVVESRDLIKKAKELILKHRILMSSEQNNYYCKFCSCNTGQNTQHCRLNRYFDIHFFLYFNNYIYIT